MFLSIISRCSNAITRLLLSFSTLILFLLCSFFSNFLFASHRAFVFSSLLLFLLFCLFLIQSIFHSFYNSLPHFIPAFLHVLTNCDTCSSLNPYSLIFSCTLPTFNHSYHLPFCLHVLISLVMSCPDFFFTCPHSTPFLFSVFLTLLLKNLYNHHSLSFFFPQLFKILIILVLPPLLNLLPSPSLVSCPLSSFLLYLAFSLPSRSRTPCS